MELHEVKILRKTKLAENEWRFDFDAPALCAEAVPGQFVMVETSHGRRHFCVAPSASTNARTVCSR